MQLTIEKILVPVDFSDRSLAALEMASSMAIARQAALVIVHVVEPIKPVAPTETFTDVSVANLDAERERLEQVVPHDSTVPYEHRLLEGHPPSAIVQLAGAEHADLIVMSTHGRRGLRRMLMGSVAEEVVRRAPCPVLTLKDPSELLAEEDAEGESDEQRESDTEARARSESDPAQPEHEGAQHYQG